MIGKPTYTLGIESSCDETGIAVLKDGTEMLSTVVASSLKLHKKFGGAVPEIASRHCLEYIQPVYEEALEKAGIKEEDLSLVGVTYGPGLVGSLLVGVSFAKALSYRLGIPIIGINHLEAHLYVCGVDFDIEKDFIGLLISGGHSSIVSSTKKGLELLGDTRDDALGEAFDKVSTMLNLGYPGGPKVEKLAKEGDASKVKLTSAKLPGSFDFSFSGIKTGVLYYIRDCEDVEKATPDICAAFQTSVFDVVIEKTLRAAEENGIKTVVVGGGVSANRTLRGLLTDAAEPKGIEVIFPEIKYAIDNGAMIAKRAYDLHLTGDESAYDLSVAPNLDF